jgi:hypothetical protein
MSGESLYQSASGYDDEYLRTLTYEEKMLIWALCSGGFHPKSSVPTDLDLWQWKHTMAEVESKANHSFHEVERLRQGLTIPYQGTPQCPKDLSVGPAS